jgi:hypothetical protein
MSLNISNTVDNIINALKGSLEESWSTVSVFAEDQAKKLANQAAMIAQARILGSLKDDDDLFDFFIDQLKEMTANFAKGIANLTLLTIEKAWNAIVGAVWGAINGTLSSAVLGPLPIPPASGS